MAFQIHLVVFIAILLCRVDFFSVIANETLIRDEDIQLRIFSEPPHPDSSVTTNPGANIELSILNHRGKFIIDMKDDQSNLICRGELVAKNGQPFRCRQAAGNLHHGDNMLFISIIDPSTKEEMWSTTSHFFYPHDSLPVLWYHPILERKNTIAALSLMTLLRYGWKRYHAPLEVVGRAYEQPKLTYIHPPRPSPSLSSLPPHLALGPPHAPPHPSARSKAFTRDALQNRGWRWLTYGAFLSAGMLLGRPSSNLIPTSAIRQSIATALRPKTTTATSIQPHPNNYQTNHMTTQHLASTLPFAAILARGGKWRWLVMCAAQVIISALMLKPKAQTTRYFQNAGVHDGFIPLH